MNKPNKFWDFINNSHVRLKIKPGQVLQWHRRGWNGEGYSWEEQMWYVQDSILRNEYCSGARDCDGSHRSGGILVCPLNELAEDVSFHDPAIKKPNWRKEEDWQRDAFAEQNNY